MTGRPITTTPDARVLEGYTAIALARRVTRPVRRSPGGRRPLPRPPRQLRPRPGCHRLTGQGRAPAQAGALERLPVAAHHRWRVAELDAALADRRDVPEAAELHDLTCDGDGSSGTRPVK